MIERPERRTVLRRILEARRALPENVRALGWVSLANDFASELAYPVLPLFLALTLGAPVAVIGLIEGAAEGVSVGLRGVSGWLSDRTGERRRPWIIAGYGISALMRPLVAAAPHWGYVLGARIGDRLGKGARTAPRDALLRDSSPPELVGASFGYHRAADSVGAVVGPLLAAALLAAGASLRTVLWVAVVPGLLSVPLLRRVKEAARRPGRSRHEEPPVQRLPRRFWIVLSIWTLFSLGNSSDVFLILRAQQIGLGTPLVILAYALYNLIYAGFAWPLGSLSDRVPRSSVLGGGLLVFAAVYLAFAFTASSWSIWLLFAVYGLYIAATEGVARAWIADEAPLHAGGKAFGLFAAANGGALLLSSIAAGLLWSHVSPRAPFVLGAATALLAFAGIVAFALSRPPIEPGLT